nr:glycosyltransferase family 2 protein [Acidobacterium sp. S8]
MTTINDSIASLNSVCAVVVTFKPHLDVLENLRKVRPQVEGLVVVDNGSPSEAFAPFRLASTALSFALIENGENLGIAAALNKGVKWAEKRGFRWVVLFDQDSTVENKFIESLFATYQIQTDREHIGIIVPSYIDRFSGRKMPVERTKHGEILVVRTSGSLMPLSVFGECGYFIEELVIDQVDYEYCLRIGCRGYKIISSENASLLHSLGERRRHNIGEHYLFATTHHNVKRRYYITRNRVWIIKSYWRQYPRYCFQLLNDSIKDSIKILLVEKSRLQKLRNTFLGLFDGLTGRMGKTIEL